MVSGQLEGRTIILFIRHEDRKTLINQFYRFSTDGSGIQALDLNKQKVFMWATIHNDSLMYTWGSTKNGKLGTG